MSQGFPPPVSGSPAGTKEASAFLVEEVLDSMSDAFIALDREWRITFVNRCYLRLVAPLHPTRADLLGHTLWEKFPDVLDSEAGRHYRHAMQTQQPVNFELFYEPLKTWLDVRTHPSSHGLAIYIRDVTAQKTNAARLADLSRQVGEQSRIFDAILSNVPDLAYAFDREFRFLYANKPLVSLLGRPLDQIVGKTCLELGYPPELAARLESQMREVFATGKEFRGDTPLASASGRIDHHEYIYSPAFDAEGHVTALVGTTRLVTDRKRVEDDVRNAERQLRLVTDNASVLLAHMDREYRYKFVNRPYARRYGREPHEVVGRHALDIAGPELFERARPFIDQALAGEEVEFELDISQPGRDVRWSHVVYTPERALDGTIVGFVAVHTDITLRKRAELEATRARDEALAAGRAKDDFLAALSHELRTPLNPVLLLASEAASNAAFPADVRETFSTIAKNVQLEARLIDDLLDLTRITRGKMSLQMQPVDVHAALRDALTTLSPEIRNRDLRLDFRPHAPAFVIEGDPARLQQIFWNILKNAVKFTGAGGEIVVRTSIAENGRLCIEISDTGIGMTAAELSKVFDSFSQGDHAGQFGSHRFGGLGLGLSISRQLAELHAGSIDARSAGPGQGSTFLIHFPLCARPVAPAPTSDSRSPLGADTARRTGFSRRVLLVEDHEPTRKTLAHLLARRKYDVVAAGTVAEAIAAADGKKMDFVISDIGLPDGSGHELMAHLRERHGLKGIALSGYGMDHDIARGRAAGFSYHLTKPVDVQNLEAALAGITAGLR